MVKGAGELASGTARRLFLCGFRVAMTENSEPTAIRRKVAFSEAVYEGMTLVDGVWARLAKGMDEIAEAWKEGGLAVVVDPEARIVKGLQPEVLVDGRMAKKNLGTRMDEATVVIGLGPGFVAGRDVHAVVETNRGHDLGRVINSGEAEANTGLPGEVAGVSEKRLLRSPKPGRLISLKAIGELVEEGEVIAEVDGTPVRAQTKGVLRGILRDGHLVREGMKVGDVDPRGIKEYCFKVSDKANAVAGGVLEAVFRLKT